MSNDVEQPQEVQFCFKGKSVLVTGSSRGIGKAIALAFAKAGASIILHGKTQSDSLQQTQETVSQYSDAVEQWICDFSCRESTQSALKHLPSNVDILVLNASMEIRDTLLSHQAEDLQQQFDCNFQANILLLHHVLPYMRQQRRGRVVAIGSIQEVYANPSLAVYAALKTAQTHYLQTVAKTMAGEGITLNTVAPGAIFTDRNETVLASEQYRQQVQQKIPMKKIGRPQDCVGAVLFLASESAQYITGAWLPVDGGYHLGS
ncbi:3-oxoacyl-[acyl-carrier-protein] reductase FabG [Thalassocella blandensis]|nr:3-oxoacyl-[acyl-carrier-protein] reductase FabG [Thalassocella blandensis]